VTLSPTVRALLARAASIIASFALTVAVARNLSVEAAGSFFVVYTAGAVAATLGRFGVDNLALKLLGGTGSVRGELRQGWKVVTVAGLVAGPLLGVALAMLHLRGLEGAAVVWAALAVPPQSFAVVAGAILRGRGRMVSGVLAELGSVPILATILILAAAAGSDLTLTTAVAAFALSALTTAVWSVALAVRSTRAERDEPPTTHGLREFVRRRGAQLSSMMGTSLVFYSVAWAPVLVLTLVGRPDAVAWVSVASRLANFVTLVPAIQVSYLAPRFSELYHAQRLVDLNHLTRRSTRQALALVALPTFVLIVAAAPIISLLYGPGFDPAANLLRVFAVGALVVVVLGQVNLLMLLCDLEHQALLLSVAIAAVWLTLGLWLASISGATATVILAAILGIVYSVFAAIVLQTRRGVRSYA
jgi:O-antigen/teichoic acid export membrane protein